MAEAQHTVFNRNQAEEWFFKKLAALPVMGDRLSADYFLNGTTWDSRRERARQYIEAHDLQQRQCGKNSEGQPETVNQVFLRLYGEYVQKSKMKETRK